MELKLAREDFINQYPPLGMMNVRDVKYLKKSEPINLYIHIPFCSSKCDFCYYKSYVPSAISEVEKYLKYLQKEIEMYAQNSAIVNKDIHSIYFGGGTPTFLNEEQLEKLILFLKEKFKISESTEICVEARPGMETSKRKLKLLKELGLDRLSLGCQSLNDEALRINGRHHDVQTFLQTYDRAREVGIDCINVDLMSGLIGDTFSTWMDTVNHVIKLNPENIAIYKLELYYNNILYKKLRSREIFMVTNEEEADWVRKGYKRLMECGYILADNFSFIKSENVRHIHRKANWEGESMVGIGLSSHSCMKEKKCIYQNVSIQSEYYELLEKNQLPIKRAYKYSIKEEMIQRIIFGIKSIDFSRRKFEEEFGIDPVKLFPEEFNLLCEYGFLEISEDWIKTTLEGAIYADDIVREFYLPEQKMMMLGHAKRFS